ncbi:MAG: hypothetical protein LBT10_01835 [Methanobrevibacter sp.]|jgi:hypothetical protein|nr:hypothetical protein [Methanobrevibacter sp.]
MTWKDDLKTAWESGKIVYEADLDKLIDNINSIDITSSPGITQTVNTTDGSITLSNDAICDTGLIFADTSGSTNQTTLRLPGNTTTTAFIYEVNSQTMGITALLTGTYSSTTNTTTYINPSSQSYFFARYSSSQTIGTILPTVDLIKIYKILSPIGNLQSSVQSPDISGTNHNIQVVESLISSSTAHALAAGIELIDSSGVLSTTANIIYNRLILYRDYIRFTGTATGATDSNVAFVNSSGGTISLVANTPYPLITNVFSGTAPTERIIGVTTFMDDTFTTVTGIAYLIYYNNTIGIIVENNYSWGQNDVILANGVLKLN